MEDRIASFTSFEFWKAFDFFDHHQTLECHASSDLTKGASRKKKFKNWGILKVVWFDACKYTYIVLLNNYCGQNIVQNLFIS